MLIAILPIVHRVFRKCVAAKLDAQEQTVLAIINIAPRTANALVTNKKKRQEALFFLEGDVV